MSRFARVTLLVGMAVWLAGASPCQAQLVVVPSALTTIEGNSANLFPFSCSVIFSSQRYQQIYLGSEVGNGVITEIAFRQDAFSGGFGPTSSGYMVIEMSTTAQPVDGLSANLTANEGPDKTPVFVGFHNLSSAACVGNPCAFDLRIPLSTPFPFHSAAGNLLMDVRLFSCPTTGFFDAHFDAGDGVSRAYTTTSGAFSANADVFDTGGLVTRFTLSPLHPAPAASVLGLTGFAITLFALGLLAQRRGARAR